MNKKDCYYQLNQKIIFELIIATLISITIFAMLDYAGTDLLNIRYHSDSEQIMSEIERKLETLNSDHEDDLILITQEIDVLIKKVRIYGVKRMVTVFISLMIGYLCLWTGNMREIDRLRNQVMKAQREKTQAVDLKNNLIRDMSHDLHTPLTGLVAYAEIAKVQSDDNKTRSYINKILQKTEQIREMSDRLFDLALSTDEIMHLDKPLYVEDAIGDYLSEMYSNLRENNYIVIADNLRWKDVKISVDPCFLSRIIENIYSNILSYANPYKNIYIESNYDDDFVVIIISNSYCGRRNENSYGIGLESVESMMTRMGGKIETIKSKSRFSIAIWFPIINN